MSFYLGYDILVPMCIHRGFAGWVEKSMNEGDNAITIIKMSSNPFRNTTRRWRSVILYELIGPVILEHMLLCDYIIFIIESMNTIMDTASFP